MIVDNPIVLWLHAARFIAPSISQSGRSPCCANPWLFPMSDDLHNNPDLWDGEVLYLPAPTGRSAMIRAVEMYWRRQCDGKRFPTRGDIDPLDLGPLLLPYLSLVAIEADPLRVQYRLVGTEVARFYGGEMRGKWVHEIDTWPKQDIMDTHETYQRIIDHSAPQFGLSLIEWQERPDHIFEFARFPIAEDGVNITHCLGVDDFTMIEPARGRAV
jgi:hypothetical protein